VGKWEVEGRREFTPIENMLKTPKVYRK